MVRCPYTGTVWHARAEGDYVKLVAGSMGLPVLTPDEADALADELRTVAASMRQPPSPSLPGPGAGKTLPELLGPDRA